MLLLFLEARLALVFNFGLLCNVEHAHTFVVTIYISCEAAEPLKIINKNSIFEYIPS